MSKFQINFYTFYQILEGWAGNKQQSIISKHIKKITFSLEKEINSLLKKNNIKFKIFYDVVDNKTASIEHYKKFVTKNNINVVCQAPNYFKTDDWSQFLSDAIYFDSFNVFKDYNHENIFRTRLTFGSDDAVTQIRKIYPNAKIIFPICLEKNKTSVPKSELEALDLFAKNNGIYLRFINKWKDNNYYNLKDFFSSAKKDEIALLNGYITPFQLNKSSDQPDSKATYNNSRSEFLSVFLENKYDLTLVGLRLDTRLIHNSLNKIDNRFNNKILNLMPDDFVEKLALQDRIFSVNSGIQKNINDYLNWYFQIVIDKVLLIHYLYSKNSADICNENFLSETKKRLSKLDGSKDVFAGSGDLIYFKNQSRPLATNYLVEIKNSAEKNLKMSLFERQLITKKDEKKIVDVSYPNFDFIDIKDISIEDNTFKSNFYFELTTKHKSGIDIIRFNNIIDNDSEIKLIKSEKIENDYFYFRYYISAEFYFFSRAESYPFDIQNIFISYSIIDDQKYGILDGIKNQDIDRKFNSHGWNISSVRSGVIRKKENYHPHFKDSYVLISEENRISYIMSRKSSFTVIKILIPLLFLIALVVYGMYLPAEQIDRVIALLTTSFLSGIALYFSTERPNPLTLTIVDYIFIIFYLIVGLASVSVFVFDFFQDYYITGLAYSRLVLLLLTIGSIFYLYYRRNSFKSRINLDGSED
tara:strand:+ start:9635 stop:11728 length:2094 start_codon:yes stop_codon:yes gene_type:complete